MRCDFLPNDSLELFKLDFPSSFSSASAPLPAAAPASLSLFLLSFFLRHLLLLRSAQNAFAYNIKIAGSGNSKRHCMCGLSMCEYFMQICVHVCSVCVCVRCCIFDVALHVTKYLIKVACNRRRLLRLPLSDTQMPSFLTLTHTRTHTYSHTHTEVLLCYCCLFAGTVTNYKCLMSKASCRVQNDDGNLFA